MPVFNTIQKLVDDLGISVYRFQHDANLGQRTAYDLYNDPQKIPSGDVLNKICTAYGIQPGEILHWEEN